MSTRKLLEYSTSAFSNLILPILIQSTLTNLLFFSLVLEMMVSLFHLYCAYLLGPQLSNCLHAPAPGASQGALMTPLPVLPEALTY
jgi:hypothetical protein